MNFILTVSSMIFPLITFPYASRVLLAEGTGKVAFAASVANYFTMLASLGIPTYGIRECAKVKENREALSKLVQEILVINLVATVITVALYLLSITFIPRLQQDKILFLIEGINIVLNLFGVNWLYQALEQYDYITIRSVAFKVISVILMFCMVKTPSEYLSYAFVSVFALAGSNILNFLRMHRYIDLKRRSHLEFKKHLKPIFTLFAQNVTTSIYTNLDVVMLGIMKDDAIVGYYNAAVKIKVLLVTIVTSLGNVLLPRMSYYVKKGAHEAFEIVMEKSLSLTFILSIFLCGFFTFTAPECIFLLAGKDFLPAISAMRIVMLSMIPIGLTGIIGVQILTPLNKENYVLYSVMIGAVSDFVLNLFLIPMYGAAGAAFATMIAEFLVLIAQLRLGWNIIRNAMKKTRYILYIFATLMAQAACMSMKTLLSENIHVFIRLVLFGLVYTIVFFLVLLIGKDTVLKAF